MENLQSKAHALHAVQPFLELVEDKKFISANHQQGHAIAKAMAMDLFLFLV
jgi:hypothetical protein